MRLAIKVMATGLFDLHCSRCKWTASGLNPERAEKSADRHQGENVGHRVTQVEQLPKKPIVGDRVRLKPELEKVARAAYPDEPIPSVLTVIAEFDNRVYGEAMLRLDGVPHAARPNQLELAWRNDAERRVGLGL